MTSPESYFDIVDRQPITGGHSAATKERVQIRADDGSLQTILLKYTYATEAIGLRAASQVPASAIPELLGSGRDDHGDWIAIPFYTGKPAPSEEEIPEEVAESLATLHAAYLGTGPLDQLPIIDSDWWRGCCELTRLDQLQIRPLASTIQQIHSWADHPDLHQTLNQLPRTLLHGDVHKNNVIIDGTGGHLVDWGAAQVGIPQLDLITIADRGSANYQRYAYTWKSLTGASVAARDWQRGYLAATVVVNVKYLTFAARQFGVSAALAMAEKATAALAELESLNSD